MDAREIYTVKLLKMGNSNNFHSIPVIAKDDESFFVSSGRGRIDIRDEDLKPNKEGKYIINIEALDLGFFFQGADLPKEFELPKEVLDKRSYIRKIKEIEKEAIHKKDYQGKRLYFYLADEKLKIELYSFDENGQMNTEPERETEADKIEIIHNRKAVNIKKLKLSHPYLELPGEVEKIFSNVLQAAELRKLALIPAGTSLLNGLPYWKLNIDIPVSLFDQVKSYFEDFGNEGTMQGFLTCEPETVSRKLGIPIEGL